MKLSRPKVITFWIAVILAALGVLASQGILAPSLQLRILAGSSRIYFVGARKFVGNF